MLVIELNEADQTILNKFVALNYLPTFKKLLQEGSVLETKVTLIPFNEAKLNPWSIWSSIYTGMSPEEHQIIGYGQSSEALQNKCIWDTLNHKGISTGLIGNLVSYPARQNKNTLFYIPESLKETKECFPESYQPIQDFLSFIAHPAREHFIIHAAKALWKLLRNVLSILPIRQGLEIFKEISKDNFKALQYYQNRALIHAKLQMICFENLYQKYQPQFATLHLNHIAHQQHKKPNALHESSMLERFKLTDQFLARLLPFLAPNTLLVIMTGHAQKNKEEKGKTNSHKVRLNDMAGILKLSDINEYEILSQIETDITLNFKEEAEASLAAFKLSNLKVLGERPLLKVEQKETQLFVQGKVTSVAWSLGNEAWLEHETTKKTARLFDYVSRVEIKPKSTLDNGWMLLYGNVAPLSVETNVLEITDICPFLTHYFD